MEEEIIQKIYSFTADLASQQKNNHELASGLSSQLAELKQKATTRHSDDDQDVKIPNPLLPEQRDEILETLKTRLEKALIDQQTTATTNKELEKECAELQALVKEYEAGLESVATKLRSHAHATTEGQIRLRREYEALLNAEKGTTAALFMENTMLQTQLRQLSKSLREVYKMEATGIHDQQIAQLKQENQDLLELLSISKLSDPKAEIPIVTERASPVLQVTRNGVIEEFFNSD